MLGIDIVDLHDPSLKERDERSLKLILNPNDQLIDHKNIFWLLWSAKEAVFKCNREAINYAPTTIPVRIKSENGSITFTSGSFEGSIEITNDYILSYCSDRLQEVHYEIATSDKTMDGDKLRNEVIDYFKKQNIPVQIGSDKLNLPILLPSKTEMSISHHGKFGAFIFPTSIIN